MAFENTNIAEANVENKENPIKSTEAAKQALGAAVGDVDRYLEKLNKEVVVPGMNQIGPWEGFKMGKEGKEAILKGVSDKINAAFQKMMSDPENQGLDKNMIMARFERTSAEALKTELRADLNTRIRNAIEKPDVVKKITEIESGKAVPDPAAQESLKIMLDAVRKGQMQGIKDEFDLVEQTCVGSIIGGKNFSIAKINQLFINWKSAIQSEQLKQ